MPRGILGALLLIALALASACSSIGDYPPAWHESKDAIHVCGPLETRTVLVPRGSEPITLLQAIPEEWKGKVDLSCVSLFREGGGPRLRVDVNVDEMLRTGETRYNVTLQPGDVLQVRG